VTNTFPMHNLTPKLISGSRPFLICLSKIKSIRHKCPITSQFPMIGGDQIGAHLHTHTCSPHTHTHIAYRNSPMGVEIGLFLFSLITSYHASLPNAAVSASHCDEKGNSPVSTSAMVSTSA
jgi:hypothetical protein